MKYISLITTAVLSNVTAVPCLAVTADQTIGTEAVSFADLDLTKPSDQARLERRVRFAVARMCPGDDSASPAPPPPNAACAAAAVADARAQMERAFARANDRSRFGSSITGEKR